MADNIKKKKASTLQTKKKMKSVKTSETIEWFCFVRSVTGLNIPSTGRDNDDTKIKLV
jgi:hypothetical protein